MSEWTTKDGERIPIRDMTDSHLMNTIRYLERAYSAGLNVYCFGYQPSGEAAQDAMMAEYDHYLDAGPSGLTPKYDELVAEALRRGLTTEEQRGEERMSCELRAISRSGP